MVRVVGVTRATIIRSCQTHKFVFETLTFYAMSEFRKSLPTVENDFSDSENEEYFNLPNDGDHKKRKRRQIKPPKKLSEYETEGSMDNTDDELCMYAVSVYCFESLYKVLLLRCTVCSDAVTVVS